MNSDRTDHDKQPPILCRIAWLFDPHMIFAAVAASLVIAGFSDLFEAANHRGPGYVWVYYEGASPVGDAAGYAEKASETRYKRFKRADGYTSIFLGVVFWVLFARSLRDVRASRPPCAGVD